MLTTMYAANCAHRIVPHRTTAHRIVPHRTTSHHIARHGTTTQRNAIHFVNNIMKGPTYQWHNAFHGKFGTLPFPGSVVKYKKVASLLQFAGASFYHLVMEVLPRLVLLKRKIEEDPELKILVCKDTSKSQFATSFFKLFFSSDAQQDVLTRFEEYDCSGPNNVRVRAKTLLYPAWDRVVAHDHVAHSLAPPTLLKELRANVRARVSAQHQQTATKTVVYCTRKGQSMRELVGEADFIARIAQTVTAASADYELVVFDGKMPAVTAMALFSRAAVVVGVHGGALTNIIACAEGSTLIELGFNAGFTRHYASAAQGLGMRYVLRVRCILFFFFTYKLKIVLCVFFFAGEGGGEGVRGLGRMPLMGVRPFFPPWGSPGRCNLY